MNLYKVITISVDGFEGNEFEHVSFMLTDKKMENDAPIDQDEVIEADVVFLDYNKYEDLGPISEDEIKILKKFTII